MSGPPVRYTRELLAQVAGTASSIDEVITFFGTRPYGYLRRYLFKRFAHFGIDVSHFRHCGSLTRHTRPEPSVLCEAVAASQSLAETLRRLRRPDNGAQRKMLRAWIGEERIDTSHFLGQAHRRGKPGSTPRRTAAEILVRHDSPRRTRTVLLRRALREVGVPDRCARYGTPPVWNGRPMTLEIDHISGDWSDDRRENLRLLCPNCHAITSTWCRGGRRRPPKKNLRSTEATQPVP
ncbi:HNH endonuclease [Streptomyces flavofungini]|uniref:HNH endonuclease n=1 Tax=Streptomyces flavofungini TaxID=68200 RepID=UPI0034DF1CD0